MKDLLFMFFGLIGISVFILIEVLIFNWLLKFDWDKAETMEYLTFVFGLSTLNFLLALGYGFLDTLYGFSKKLV